MPESELTNNAAITLLQTANKISAHLALKLEPLDLSMSQLKILWILYQQPEHRATVNQIKAQMSDPSSNVSRLLNKLMAKKCILKHRSSTDQRIVYISITELGIEQMCAGRVIMDEGFSCFNKVSESELLDLISTLNKLSS